MTNEPDVRVTRVEFGVDKFLLMASDGLFDNITSQDAIYYVLE